MLDKQADVEYVENDEAGLGAGWLEIWPMGWLEDGQALQTVCICSPHFHESYEENQLGAGC